MPAKRRPVEAISVVTDVEPAADTPKAVRATRRAAPPVYVETVTREVEREGKLVKVTLGKRFVAVHREDPPGSGRWLDYQEEVWEEVGG
jgi:hypothetical protein